jgi:hypothetical protein
MVPEFLVVANLSSGTLGNSQEKFQKFGIKVIGGFCLGRGIVPGDAVANSAAVPGTVKTA